MRDSLGRFKKGHTSPLKGIKRPELIGNTRGFTKGMTPWNKGKTGIYSKGYRMKISNSLRGRVGKDARNWKGGETIDKGYMFISQPFHPNCNNKGYVKRANLVMEKHIKRFMNKGEVIHHIDSDRLNDTIDNLMLFENHSKHMLFHGLNKS